MPGMLPRTLLPLLMLLGVMLAACGGDTESCTTETITVTVTAPTEPGAVPCPDDAFALCQLWYGTEQAGPICMSDNTSRPAADPDDCGRANPGIVPAIYCCPTPPLHASDGPLIEPECTEIECDDPNDAQTDCDTWLPHTTVGHCTAQDTLRCRLPARWGICSAYDHELLCCSH